MPPLIVILGPTASGKTALATALAQKMGGEILSADSRQVFRGMDIGTGKDLADFNRDGQQIPYHLINIRDAGEQYHVRAFQEDFKEAYADVLKRQKPAILCGGTGMYISAVLDGFGLTAIPDNPSLRAQLQPLPHKELLIQFNALKSPLPYTVDTSSSKRLIRALEIAQYLEHHSFDSKSERLEAVIFGIDITREMRRQRITDRLHARLEEGMIEEVEALIAQGVDAAQLKWYGLEYKFITQYLEKTLSRDQMVEQLNIAIHQFAKRQMTYFRKMEKDGHHIHWLDACWSEQTKLEHIEATLGN